MPFDSHRDDAAIWLFSGGTTGRPKGVVQTHRSFANTTALYGHGVLGVGSEDVTISVPKLFFGYATGANLFFPMPPGGSFAWVSAYVARSKNDAGVYLTFSKLYDIARDE